MALYRTVSHREHGCTIDKNNLTLHTCKVPKIATKNGQISQMTEFCQAPKMKLADQSFGDFGFLVVTLAIFWYILHVWLSETLEWWYACERVNEWSFSWQPPRWKKRLIWDCPKVFPGFIKAFHNECEGSSFNCPVTKERRDYAEKAINAFST